QAEDGIRDFHVTGVQTCALPISNTLRRIQTHHRPPLWRASVLCHPRERHSNTTASPPSLKRCTQLQNYGSALSQTHTVLSREHRSEERRVGKECRARWSSSYELE